MKYIISLLFLFVSLSAIAEKHCVFTPINGTNGLAGNRVRNISQLPDGRMMIITEGLLSLYDGTDFSYLHYNQKHISQLSEYSGFHHEYIDDHGHMWIKNQRQLMVVDVALERFVEQPDSLLASWGIDSPMKDFFMDKAKNIWIITDKDELVRIDKVSLKAETFLPHVSSTSNATDQVYDLGVLGEQLYLFYRSGLLVCYNQKTHKEVYRQNLSDELPKGKYEKTSYVVSGNNTFYQLRNGNRGGVMLNYNVTKRKWDVVFQTDYRLNSLSIDKDGSIWISCFMGLWNIDAELKKKQYIPNLKLVDGSTINTEVSTLYNDNQGGMWLGTLNQGILYYHPNRFRFQNIGRTLFSTPKEINIYVTGFTTDKKGNILVGTRKGLFYYNPSDGSLNPYSKELSAINCNTLFKDSRQRIWLGTSGRELYCIMPDGQTICYTLHGQTIHSIMELPDKTLYLCLDNQGFGTFSPETGKFEKEANMPQENGSTVYQLAPLGKDSIAGITRKGWFIYDRKTKEHTFSSNSHVCNSIIADRQKRIWIGLEDGLLLWNTNTGQQHTFYTTDGLINNSIRSIIQTEDNAIWVSTSNGITRIWATEEQEPSSYSFTNFNQYDGIITDEFCERSAFIATDGTLYWGGINGFNKYTPSLTKIERSYSAPLFVGFELLGEQVENGKTYNDNRILCRPITQTKEIILNHNQNFFTLEFSALNYINPTQTYYRYQLIGVDHSEREIRSSAGKGYATYTNVAPGTYTFRVQTADNSEAWKDKYAEMRIIVKAPFWKTTYAYIFYILFIAGGITLFILIYIKGKRRKLLREQREKLDEMKSTFLQNINEELKEPINKIISPIDNILKRTDKEENKLLLEEVRNNAVELKELVNQLSEGVLSPLSSNEKEWTLEELLLNMRQLLEQQEKRKEQFQSNQKLAPNNSLLSATDEAFLRRVLQYIEQNIDNPEYSVEVLSRDMGIDRTGLYRKLISVVGKTPTNFIRSIRLKRAAQLLKEGYTVAEVADLVGFNTSSYLSKCFQEEFGVRPSQYINQWKAR
ncbi:MAG TPA: helix-turn-helix domain-containing protein [Bacteroides reticulotermitis]|nr:helix-turn-helix domain-containing protein [Bacteroides reticulotermitis]